MTESSSAAPTLELRRYVDILRRRATWVVATFVAGLACAGGYLMLVPTEVTAATLVNVNVISLEPFNNTREPSGLIDSQTEVQTARSSTVVSRTAEELGGDLTASEVRDALAVELYPDGTVLRISYTAGTVKDAILGADEAAGQFLAYRGELAAMKLTTITTQLTERRDLLRNDLLRVNRDLNRTGARGIQAESDRQLLNLELDSLLGQINQINAVDTTGGTVLTGANDVGASVRPQQGMILLGGGLVGLLAGLVLAFVRDALDRRVRDLRDIGHSGAGPVLATLSERHATVPAHGSDLDAVRSLWEGLLVTLPEDGPVVVVADVTGRSTPSDVAVNLALAMTQTGRTVELVLPEQSPGSAGFLGGPSRLTGVVGETGVVRAEAADHPLLRVAFVAGDQAEEPSAAALLVDVLESAKQSADVTVVATSAAQSRSTRMAAARLGDETLVVVAPRQSRRRMLEEVVGDLNEVRAQIAGAVVVHPRRVLDEPAGPDASASSSATLQPVAAGQPSETPREHGPDDDGTTEPAEKRAESRTETASTGRDR